MKKLLLVILLCNCSLNQTVLYKPTARIYPSRNLEGTFITFYEVGNVKITDGYLSQAQDEIFWLEDEFFAGREETTRFFQEVPIRIYLYENQVNCSDNPQEKCMGVSYPDNSIHMQYISCMKDSSFIHELLHLLSKRYFENSDPNHLNHNLFGQEHSLATRSRRELECPCPSARDNSGECPDNLPPFYNR